MWLSVPTAPALWQKNGWDLMAARPAQVQWNTASNKAKCEIWAPHSPLQPSLHTHAHTHTQRHTRRRETETEIEMGRRESPSNFRKMSFKQK